MAGPPQGSRGAPSPSELGLVGWAAGGTGRQRPRLNTRQHPAYRMFKDSGMYCKKFTTTDADLIFTQVRRRVGALRFVQTLARHCGIRMPAFRR